MMTNVTRVHIKEFRFRNCDEPACGNCGYPFDGTEFVYDDETHLYCSKRCVSESQTRRETSLKFEEIRV